MLQLKTASEPTTAAELFARYSAARQRLRGPDPDKPTIRTVLHQQRLANVMKRKREEALKASEQDIEHRRILKIIADFNAYTYRNPISNRISAIIGLTARAFRVSVDDLLGPSREAAIVHPRHVAASLACRLSNQPMKEIGRKFNRDHATIIHAKRCADPIVAAALATLPVLQFMPASGSIAA